jgi:hypothetical protein
MTANSNMVAHISSPDSMILAPGFRMTEFRSQRSGAEKQLADYRADTVFDLRAFWRARPDNKVGV